MFQTKLKFDQSSCPPSERTKLTKGILAELAHMEPADAPYPALIQGEPKDPYVVYVLFTEDVDGDEGLAFSYAVSTLRAAVHGASSQADTPNWPTEGDILEYVHAVRNEQEHEAAWRRANLKGFRIVWRPLP